MTAATTAIQAAITEAGRLEKVLKDGRPRRQVTLADERATAKATAFSWFEHKKSIVATMSGVDTGRIDAAYQKILVAAERAGVRSKYLALLKEIRTQLIRLQSECAAMPATPTHTGDAPPSFAPLISDAAMQTILKERWHECTKCIAADVPLAATVMMGGLLEALLLAQINRESDKRPSSQLVKRLKIALGKPGRSPNGCSKISLILCTNSAGSRFRQRMWALCSGITAITFTRKSNFRTAYICSWTTQNYFGKSARASHGK